MTRSIALLAAGCLVIGLAGCASQEEEPDASSSSPDDAFQPTESPSVPVTLIDPPGDYSPIEGENYTISAPGEFQQQFSKSSNGERMLVLEKPSAVETLPQRVVVIRDVEPEASAAEQSYTLETTKAAAGPEAGASRVEVPTGNEADSAYLITWEEARPAGDGEEPVDVTYWQLMYQTDGGPILNVVALAPTAEFESSEVSKILRTFAPTSPA